MRAVCCKDSPVAGCLTDLTGCTSNILKRSASIATKFCRIDLEMRKTKVIVGVKLFSLPSFSSEITFIITLED